MLTRVRPVAVAENTNKRRSPAVTGMESPVAVPLEIVPRARTPVRSGVNVTIAPGITVNVFVGVGPAERKTCAEMVMLEPTRDKAAVC